MYINLKSFIMANTKKLKLNIPKEYRKDIILAIDILKNYGCTEIYLFGSITTGLIHKNTDIDFAVKGLDKKFFFKAGGELMMNLDHSFDLIELDNENSNFSKHIQSKGNLVRVA